MVKRLVKRAGIDKRISPHRLRHSFITAALDAGVPLRDVQEAASHADPRTTMRYEIWNSDPLFYPAKPPAHWLMVAEIAGEVLMVPLAPSDHDDPTRCRPIGCYRAAKHLADRYKEDR
jgi:hypothetical protein